MRVISAIVCFLLSFFIGILLLFLLSFFIGILLLFFSNQILNVLNDGIYFKFETTVDQNFEVVLLSDLFVVLQRKFLQWLGLYSFSNRSREELIADGIWLKVFNSWWFQVALVDEAELKQFTQVLLFIMVSICHPSFDFFDRSRPFVTYMMAGLQANNQKPPHGL